jgi:hypothetical protein
MSDTATEAKAEEKAPKKEKAPLPDGFVTPVTFAKELGAKLGKEIRPQIIYGYVKNNGPQSKNPFPFEKNSDGAFIVNRDAAFAWYDALQERKTTREAANAAKAAAAAAKADAEDAAKTMMAESAEPAKGKGKS